MKNKKWIRIIRILALTGIVAGTIVGIGTQTNLGTLCSLCPLGFLQISLASRTIAINMLWPVLAIVGATILLGKAFCAWVCPTTLTREAFKGEKVKKPKADKNCDQGCGTCASGSDKKTSHYGYGIMIGALIASFIVGFPVFCLVCPIGIFFGFIYAVYRLSVFYTPGWELLIFPTIFIIEVFLLRSWCKNICPIGAIFSFFGKISPVTIKPKIQKDLCIECDICSSACSEKISVWNGTKEEMDSCNLCLECYIECPTNAIQIGPKNIKPKLATAFGDTEKMG